MIQQMLLFLFQSHQPSVFVMKLLNCFIVYKASGRHFLGEKPESHEGNVYLAHTLEETAKIAVDLASGENVKANYNEDLKNTVTSELAKEKTVKGLTQEAPSS